VDFASVIAAVLATDVLDLGGFVVVREYELSEFNVDAAKFVGRSIVNDQAIFALFQTKLVSNNGPRFRIGDARGETVMDAWLTFEEIAGALGNCKPRRPAFLTVFVEGLRKRDFGLLLSKAKLLARGRENFAKLRVVVVFIDAEFRIGRDARSRANFSSRFMKRR